MSIIGSAALFNSDNHGMIYSGCDNYIDPKYFIDPPPGFNVLDNPFRRSQSKNSFSSSLVISRNNAFEFDYESDLDSQSPEYDEDKVRLKLQELEKALLDDDNTTNHDDDVHNHAHRMETDGEWSVPTSYTLLNDSPTGSSSSGSNLSSISSTKENPISTQSTKHLLFECAAAVHNGNFDQALCMINVFRQHVSILGNPSDRINAYMVEALAARLATSGGGLYKALKCKEAPSSDRLSAMQVLFEACPCFRFGFMAANGAILEAFKDENRVRIIDFDIHQGNQYYSLLQALAKTKHGDGPHIRLTGVDNPESVNQPVGGLKIVGRRLEQLGKDLKIKFEFEAISSEAALISPSRLGSHPGEALVVNFALQLHHLPDESVSTLNLRDRLLQMVKNMKPKLVTVVEQDLNANTSPFLQRFAEAYDYYHAVFDSLDATLARDNQERMNVEKHCLARDIINVVACEGAERIERFEVAGKWRSRMRMAGFTASPISQNVGDEIRGLIKGYSDRYKVGEEEGELHFAWEEKILIVTSAWR